MAAKEDGTMETAELTIHLPKKDLEFATQYARAHGLTLAQLIDRQLRRLRIRTPAEIHPEVERISGLVPPQVDARMEYCEHVLKKHR